MIAEDYVSFEIAKLLKENGFNGKCLKVWIYSKSIDLENNVQLVSSPHFMEGEMVVDNADVHKILTTEEFYEDAYLCPTLQMAMKWLREMHNLFIEIQCYGCEYDEKAHFEYSYVISEYVKFNTGDCTIFSLEKRNAKSRFLSPEQACEAAIKYCLENLI